MNYAFVAREGSECKTIARLTASGVWSGDPRVVDQLKQEIRERNLDLSKPADSQALMRMYSGSYFWVAKEGETKKHHAGQHDQRRHGWRFSGARATNPELIKDPDERTAYSTAFARRAGVADVKADMAIAAARKNYATSLESLEKSLEPARDVIKKRREVENEIDRVRMENVAIWQRLGAEHDKASAELTKANNRNPRVRTPESFNRQQQDIARARKRYDAAWDNMYGRNGEGSIAERRVKALEDALDATRDAGKSANDILVAAHATRANLEQQYLAAVAPHSQRSLAARMAEGALMRKAMDADETNLRQRRDKLQAEFDSLEKRANALSSKVDTDPKAKAEYHRLIDRMSDAAMKQGESYGDGRARLYQTAGKRQVDYDPDRPFSTDDKKHIENGVDEFNRLAGPNPLLASRTTRVEIVDGRAFADNSKIHLDRAPKEWVVVHEMGHILEHDDPMIRESVFDFYRRRTAGEKTTKLSEATGINYDDHEVTKLDKFIEPYMGKDYSVYSSSGKMGATEILSMGIQMFFQNPKMLAAKDPDYFDFIYAVLRMGQE